MSFLTFQPKKPKESSFKFLEDLGKKYRVDDEDNWSTNINREEDETYLKYYKNAHLGLDFDFTTLENHLKQVEKEQKDFKSKMAEIESSNEEFRQKQEFFEEKIKYKNHQIQDVFLFFSTGCFVFFVELSSCCFLLFSWKYTLKTMGILSANSRHVHFSLLFSLDKNGGRFGATLDAKQIVLKFFFENLSLSV
jgi:hypothetical protein